MGEVLNLGNNRDLKPGDMVVVTVMSPPKIGYIREIFNDTKEAHIQIEGYDDVFEFSSLLKIIGHEIQIEAVWEYGVQHTASRLRTSYVEPAGSEEAAKDMLKCYNPECKPYLVKRLRPKIEPRWEKA